jgi:hypothetical protein
MLIVARGKFAKNRTAGFQSCFVMRTSYVASGVIRIRARRSSTVFPNAALPGSSCPKYAG